LNQFEFLFSLYGLLLGLGVADLASGFSRAYDKRKTQPIGWLAPALGALLICDLLTFWLAAWEYREWQVTYLLALGATIVGLIYYFAASQVFPREGSTETPEDHAMSRRKLVAASILAINVIVFFGPAFAQLVQYGAPALPPNLVNAVYAALLIWLFFTPSPRQAAIAAWLGVAVLILMGILVWAFVVLS